ncbi:localization of periplasmic protein complex [Leptolyngbya sp. Heron Island J]|uniref:AMIN domain-containing protein n=1 Tax=Leptolyngbya sp. Heron Island J TaxID=1385935 RepID=UPI0003B981D0|nr:AMIN domain-containing protein [Leptolyngbya sp. Heron Island J]ESA37612.1 localization of periplasmic protein complex [Leptolyngbya sp. Heron Island J]
MGFKRRFYQVLGGSLSVLALSVAPALAEELQDWAFDTSSSELTFSLSDQVFPAFFLLAEPPRLVLDIPDTAIGDVDPEQIYDGTVRSIRVSQHTPENVRVVIELASDIVLSPAQADIQFDEGGDGQRHWRFRPLLAENDTAVTATVNTTAPSRSSEADTSSSTDPSLSAVNLELTEQPSSSAVLPVDPYEAESSTSLVSVPPLEDLSETDLPGSTAADVPDLPPMTVPELEETGADDALTATMREEVEASRQETLPNLEIGVDNAQPGVSVAVEPLSVESSQPTAPEVGNHASEDAPVAVSTNVGSTATGPEDVVPVIEQPEEEPAVIDSSTAEVVTPVGPTETALAPIESSSPQSDNLQPARGDAALQTIQQPAAARTIVQTAPPTPLPFGQPLPEDL